LDEDGALFDTGIDGGGHFRVTPESGGVSLDSALRDFGPAAIDDLIPRVRVLAAQLDAAHEAGVVHGALHPNKVIVTDQATSIVAGKSSASPYLAPEVMAGGERTPAADQFALAAIVYEWMFGRPIAGPAERTIDVRSMPGVERVALAKAFTRALALKPADRFASCTAFCDALAAAVVPELPLLALEPEPTPDARPEYDDDLKITAEPFDSEDEPLLAQDKEPDVAPMDPVLSAPAPVAVPAWNPGGSMSATPSREAQRFGGGALILATIVGSIFGFAAGYMARPRALQSGPPQTIATAPQATEAPVAAGKADPAPPARPAPPAPPAKEAPGRILVRSTPSGATVTVDGVAKGTTPVALRELDLGTRNIVVARRGYLPETHKVTITAARPARTLDVRLSAEAASAAPRPSTSASAATGRSGATATTGSVQVDSRPAGAAVTIDGKPAGTTPLTINDLAPADYRIVMTLPGFRSFATTVRVVAGERVRAAASLTAQEQE
jgi:hypothetical protein